MTLTREQAQNIINSERDYQDHKFPGKALHPSDGLRIISVILRKNDEAWKAIQTGTDASLQVDLVAARKIAAVCQCLIETWGAPAREEAK